MFIFTIFSFQKNEIFYKKEQSTLTRFALFVP